MPIIEMIEFSEVRKISGSNQGQMVLLLYATNDEKRIFIDIKSESKYEVNSLYHLIHACLGNVFKLKIVNNKLKVTYKSFHPPFGHDIARIIEKYFEEDLLNMIPDGEWQLELYVAEIPK